MGLTILTKTHFEPLVVGGGEVSKPVVKHPYLLVTSIFPHMHLSKQDMIMEIRRKINSQNNKPLQMIKTFRKQFSGPTDNYMAREK